MNGDICMFWQNYNDICESNGVRPRKVAAELGIADATVTRWKNGSIPNRSTLEKIAARFDVTVEFLLDNENISVDVKEKRSTFRKLTSLPQRWASIHSGQDIDKHFLADISEFVNVDWYFLRDDSQITYEPEKVIYKSEEEIKDIDEDKVIAESAYKRYCLENTEVLHSILDIMDDCADSPEYQKLQIQLSRIVLSHLADKGIGQEQLLAYNALSSYKIEFLYSGKEKLDPTFNYGLNYSDLSVIHRKTKLSYLYMFTGIEESYGELVAELCGNS